MTAGTCVLPVVKFPSLRTIVWFGGSILLVVIISTEKQIMIMQFGVGKKNYIGWIIGKE